jgi:predicted RNA-binding Zn-ribbon protein involved in translation (DUF1610 family)
VIGPARLTQLVLQTNYENAQCLNHRSCWRPYHGWHLSLHERHPDVRRGRRLSGCLIGLGGWFVGLREKQHPIQLCRTSRVSRRREFALFVSRSPWPGVAALCVMQPDTPQAEFVCPDCGSYEVASAWTPPSYSLHCAKCSWSVATTRFPPIFDDGANHKVFLVPSNGNKHD